MRPGITDDNLAERRAQSCSASPSPSSFPLQTPPTSYPPLPKVADGFCARFPFNHHNLAFTHITHWKQSCQGSQCQPDGHPWISSSVLSNLDGLLLFETPPLACCPSLHGGLFSLSPLLAPPPVPPWMLLWLCINTFSLRHSSVLQAYHHLRVGCPSSYL